MHFLYLFEISFFCCKFERKIIAKYWEFLVETKPFSVIAL